MMARELNGLLADGPPADGLVLALRPREAARSLGVGARTLWDLTAPRGPIPAARIGACVVYPVDALRAWLAAQAGKGGTLNE
jgi:hypothetical protein